VGFVVDKVARGQVFPEYLGFPRQFLFHRLLYIHRPSSGAGTIGELVADMPSGLSLTPPKKLKKKDVSMKNFYANKYMQTTKLKTGKMHTGLKKWGIVN
jgi:hypothetical protein